MLNNIPFDRDEEMEMLRRNCRDLISELHDEAGCALRLVYELETLLATLFKMESEVK